MEARQAVISAGILFVRTSWGIIFRPYETYRTLVKRDNPWEFLYLGLMCALYFGIATSVKTPVFRPYLLSRQFALLSVSAAVGYFMMSWSLYKVGIWFGGRGTWNSISLGWGYTLIPTVIWFLATSVLFVVLPPPRTVRFAGVLFSIIYLVFSAVLFYWKLMLSYLTLRFGHRLDLWRILSVGAVAAVVLTAYSIIMYRIGIFRIPFV